MTSQRTTRTVATLPRGAVRLLRASLGRGALTPVAWLRALHVAWLVRTLGPDRTRVVATFEGDRVVAVAVTLRYDARPEPRDLVPTLGAALLAGGTAPLLGVDGPLLGTMLVALTCLAAIGALLFDGKSGIAGARRARQHATAVGLDRTWGRGLVAVATDQQGRGHGRQLVHHLVAALPHGHRWLPVAMTPAAAAFYQRLGATPLDDAACEFVAA